MTILLILILLAVGYIWFFYFSSKSREEQVVKTSSDISALKTDIMQLRRIRNLKLDRSIFEDKFFQLLQQSPLPAPSGVTETVGKQNPFAPL